MKPLSLYAALCTLIAGAATAAPITNWDDGNAPAVAVAETSYMADDSCNDAGLGYDAGLGVDPVYSTPSIYEESGKRYPSFIPNDLYMEYLGNMSFSGRHGRVQVVNAVVTIPFVNPRRAVWGSWHLDVKGTARLTWLDSDGTNLLDEDKLYTIGMQASLSRKLGRVSQLQLGFTPQFSTDFDLMSHHNFFWGGYVAFSVKPGDTFRYTLGLAYMPDYYRCAVLPVLSLQWRYHPAWQLRVEGTRLSTVCVTSERLEWGPFFQWNTGIWTVHRQRQTQQLRMTNCILGMGATYANKLSGGATLSFLGDLGFTFNNVFRMRDGSGEHTLEKYRAHPGLYARLGMRFAF